MLAPLQLLDRVSFPVNFLSSEIFTASILHYIAASYYRVSNWTVIMMMILSWRLESGGTLSVSQIVLPQWSISAKLLG